MIKIHWSQITPYGNIGSCCYCAQRWWNMGSMINWYNKPSAQPGGIAHNHAGNAQPGGWHTDRQCFEQQNFGCGQNYTLSEKQRQLKCSLASCAMVNFALVCLLQIVSCENPTHAKPSQAVVFTTQPGKWARLCVFTLQGCVQSCPAMERVTRVKVVFWALVKNVDVGSCPPPPSFKFRALVYVSFPN